MNHPSLLAFGYSYLPEDGAEPSYDTVNATDLAHFQVLTLKEIDVTLLDVHHVAASDDSLITDVIWNKDHSNNVPYCDYFAEYSWSKEYE